MNQLLWSLDPPHAKCFVAANPHMELRSVRRGPLEVPVISLAYSLRDLAIVSPFFGLLKKGRGRPTVYLLNERSSHPEIVVSFNVHNLSRRMFRHVYDPGLIDEHIKRSTRIEALTTASLTVDGYAFRKFWGNFVRSQRVEVAVVEQDSAWSDPSFNPLLHFYIYQFMRTSPEVRLY